MQPVYIGTQKLVNKLLIKNFWQEEDRATLGLVGKFLTHWICHFGSFEVDVTWYITAQIQHLTLSSQVF